MAHRPTPQPFGRALTFAERKRRVEALQSNDFFALVDAAVLDPALHFRFSDWRGANLRNLNLRGFDFTGAKLHGALLDGALIGPGPDRHGNPAKAARFDLTELGAVLHDQIVDPHDPAPMTPLADLRRAADWSSYADVKTWQAAPRPDREHLHPGAIFQDAPFAPQMVVVPAGTFLRGSPEGEGEPDERPQREVTIGYRLAVGRYPVTFEEWDACHADGGTKWKPKTTWGRGQQPVMDVSWDDATQDYLPWLNGKLGLSGAIAYRLLTEAEWEYCCRAGTQTRFSFGDDANRLGDYAWFSSNANGKTHPVGEKLSNSFGLYDMHGNVWEWCQDAFAESYHWAPDNGAAAEGMRTDVSRVLRGGSWGNIAQYLRSAYRSGDQPNDRSLINGFRLARTLLP